MTGEILTLRNFRGDSLVFGTSGVSLLAHDGLGMAPVQRVTQEGPFQHGATQVNARLAPRGITLSLAMVRDDNWSTDWLYRNALTDILNDIDHELYLDVTLPTFFLTARTVRMNVHYLDSLTMPRSGDHDGFDRSVLQLIAHDPVWYDPNPEVVTMDVTAGGEGLMVAMEIPFGLGGTIVDEVTQFLYPGTWFSYPIIRITGPIENACLTAYSIAGGTATVKLDFTGVTIAAGDYYEIDCRYGYKTVKDKTGTNKIADLTSDSDLASFVIAPHPYFQDGANQFTLTGINATNATACSVTYYNRYIGI
jgi:hypothetical protein